MWNLEELYSGIDEWLEHIAVYEEKIQSLNTNKMNHSIREMLLFREKYAIMLDRLYTYGLLLRECDLENRMIQQGIGRIHMLYKDFNVYNAHIMDYILKNRDIIQVVRDDKDLKKFYIHIRNELLTVRDGNKLTMELYNKISPYDSFVTWYASFENIGVTKLSNINEFNLLELLKDSEVSVRRETYIAVEEFLKKHVDTAAFFLNAHLQLVLNDVNSDIERIFAKKVGITDFSWNMMEKYKMDFINMNRMMIRYKCRDIMVQKISYYDLYYLPTELDQKVSINDVREIILGASEYLGRELKSVVEEVFDNDWINWSKEGHRGQRSFSSYTTHPYIKISWVGTVDNLFDIMHEIMGAVAQYLGSKDSDFFNSELSILKVEFLSILGTWCLVKYLFRDSTKIKHKLAKSKLVDYIKDSFLVPYENTFVEHEMYIEAINKKLSSDDISKIWDDFVSKYHEDNCFIQLAVNKYNWVRNEHFYLKGYDLNYILAFVYATYYYMNLLDTNDDLKNYLTLGEKITNEQFFEAIFKDIRLEKMFEDTFEYCKKILA